MKNAVCVLLLALTGAAGTARAQVASATLLGEIRDESSAVAPGVVVTARNSATGFTNTTTTNAEGVYRMDALSPGAYAVTAVKAG